MAGSYCYFGARIDGAYYFANYGASTANDAPYSATDAAPRGWDLFEAHAGKSVSSVHWGTSGTSWSPAFSTTQAANLRNRGAFSFFSVSPSQAEVNDLVAGTNTSGINGTIDAWATAAQTSGHPILLRPMWEMNGNWGFTWQTAQGVTSANYVTAWQRIWNRFATILGSGTHTGNVSFCWCPNIAVGVPDPTPWYPGSAYVDWLGFDGYAHAATSNESPSQQFNSTYAILTGINSSLPIAIGETACSTAITSPTKAAWITDLLDSWIPSHPQVRAFSWFNEAGNPADPWIEDGAGALAAFQASIAHPRYHSNIVNSATFPSNQKVPIPGTYYETRRAVAGFRI